MISLRTERLISIKIFKNKKPEYLKFQTLLGKSAKWRERRSVLGV